jgi:hypothetical protein
VAVLDFCVRRQRGRPLPAYNFAYPNKRQRHAGSSRRDWCAFVRLLSKSGVAVEKLFPAKFAKIKSRQDAPQTTFSVFLDIFYPPIFGYFEENGLSQHPRLVTSTMHPPPQPVPCLLTPQIRELRPQCVAMEPPCKSFSAYANLKKFVWR